MDAPTSCASRTPKRPPSASVLHRGELLGQAVAILGRLAAALAEVRIIGAPSLQIATLPEPRALSLRSHVARAAPRRKVPPLNVSLGRRVHELQLPSYIVLVARWRRRSRTPY